MNQNEQVLAAIGKKGFSSIAYYFEYIAGEFNDRNIDNAMEMFCILPGWKQTDFIKWCEILGYTEIAECMREGHIDNIPEPENNGGEDQYNPPPAHRKPLPVDQMAPGSQRLFDGELCNYAPLYFVDKHWGDVLNRRELMKWERDILNGNGSKNCDNYQEAWWEIQSEAVVVYNGKLFKLFWDVYMDSGMWLVPWEHAEGLGSYYQEF